MRLAAYALFILTPFLLLGVLSLILGKNALDSWPVWSDELDYWRSLQNWNSVGFATGYSGLSEIAPEAGAFSVHGLTAIVFYGWFVKLFGLSHNTIVLCNALWVSLGALGFCLLLKPSPRACVFLCVLLGSYAPVTLYAFTSMTQLCQYGVILLYLALLLRYAGERKPLWLILASLCFLLTCCFRINYLPLIFPLTWVWGGGKKLCGKTVLFTFLGLALTIGLYFFSTRFIAPYAQGFPYALRNAGDPRLMLRMLISHFKANLIGYFRFHQVDAVQSAFRMLYLLTMLFCLMKSFLRFRTGMKGVKLGLNAAYFWCFLWLFTSWIVVLAFNDVYNWMDFRILAPALWLTPVYLLWRKKRLASGLLLAGSLILTAFLCFQPALGAYDDDDRFQPPAQNRKLSEAIACIVYDPDATDPFQNTVRTDLVEERLLTELEEGLGIHYGWFSPDSIGKSRWILTDQLKIALEGYEQVYSSYSASVYRKTEVPEEP